MSKHVRKLELVKKKTTIPYVVVIEVQRERRCSCKLPILQYSTIKSGQEYSGLKQNPMSETIFGWKPTDFIISISFSNCRTSSEV